MLCIIDRACTKEDLSQMKYLQCVIKEAMRLYAVVPYLTRVSDEDIEIDVSFDIMYRDFESIED